MKQTFCFLLLLFWGMSILSAQERDTNATHSSTSRMANSTTKDTVPTRANGLPLQTTTHPASILKQDTVHSRTGNASSQSIIGDTVKRDSFSTNEIVPGAPTLSKKNMGPNIIDKMLQDNKYINIKAHGVFFIQEERKSHGKEFLFYSLCGLTLILGIFKTVYPHYFSNLFRVFFNTSLRQNQLTDQLLQAKFPSFILNIFFMLTAGVFIWLLFEHSQTPKLVPEQWLLPACILTVAGIYILKYLLIKFMGWITGMIPVVDNYIFIIFLINKITGIVLVPFVLLLAFANTEWMVPVSTISVMLLGLFFITRYIKGYGFLQGRFSFSIFHLILYVIGAEIIPLLLLYKVAVDYVV